jgi:PKD repeat protein
MMSDMQIYNPSSGTFTMVPRPFGKMHGALGIIGTKYFSTTGEDPDWPVERLDIASFGGGGCTLTCSASANPTSGAPPLTVNFTATANASGCTGTPTFSWNFGDSATSTEQNPSHTYQAEGTYNWTMTATVDNQTCTKSGKITVSQGGQCTLTCDASATPTSGTAPLTVTFTATATATGCTGTPTFNWNFGDGANSTQQNPSHTYTTAGTYNWALTVTVDNQTCSKTGTITVTGGQVAPQITSVKKATDPFRLIIMGSNFVNGCEVYIDGAKVPQTKFKSATKVVAMKGAALKAMCPKGQTVKITVKNPDGSVSNEYNYTR